MNAIDTRIAHGFFGFGLMRSLETPVRWAARKWQMVLVKEHLDGLPEYLLRDMGLTRS